LRIRMRQELLNTQWLFKVPMLVITHDPQDVAALAENLVVLHKGRVERTVDLKGPPYRDEKGIPARGVIRQLLMETSVESNGTQASPPLRAVR
jgi:ABC-type sulfate/molybdate transport systems ATPase subunit